MNKVITSVNALLAPEGIRVAYTYSEMDDEGRSSAAAIRGISSPPARRNWRRWIR